MNLRVDTHWSVTNDNCKLYRLIIVDNISNLKGTNHKPLKLAIASVLVFFNARMY